MVLKCVILIVAIVAIVAEDPEDQIQEESKQPGEFKYPFALKDDKTGDENRKSGKVNEHFAAVDENASLSSVDNGGTNESTTPTSKLESSSSTTPRFGRLARHSTTISPSSLGGLRHTIRYSTTIAPTVSTVKYVQPHEYYSIPNVHYNTLKELWAAPAPSTPKHTEEHVAITPKPEWRNTVPIHESHRQYILLPHQYGSHAKHYANTDLNYGIPIPIHFHPVIDSNEHILNGTNEDSVHSWALVSGPVSHSVVSSHSVEINHPSTPTPTTTTTTTTEATITEPETTEATETTTLEPETTPAPEPEPSTEESIPEEPPVEAAAPDPFGHIFDSGNFLKSVIETIGSKSDPTRQSRARPIAADTEKTYAGFGVKFVTPERTDANQNILIQIPRERVENGRQLFVKQPARWGAYPGQQHGTVRSLSPEQEGLAQIVYVNPNFVAKQRETNSYGTYH